MMRKRAGRHNQTGAIGELVARKDLENKGFSIVADNYQQKWGEIDVIAKRGKVIHFVEVKAVSYETRRLLEDSLHGDNWRPEEQVTEQKLKKMGRTIESWLIENRYEEDWQIDVAAVRLVPDEKYALVKWIWNVVM